ncbi:4-oxalocrotonate tautomerase [Metallumcola ferriviriculae]|uniref:Tautomerase n=1 Tax=Metallumcola ferriviriculae TaxID=3039180 RepID=A0AAU0USR3_9FIRM|nr:4-oxalocrotonate tautomerase [Desulfitibacteraceae bacterium MK1]
MPIVQIDMIEGRTEEQKRSLARNITDAVVESVSCKPEVVKVIIRELKKEHYAEGGVLYKDR